MLVVWQEGVNVQDRNSLMLYCGDCAREIKKIPENYVDCVITSPPYDTLRTCYNIDFDLDTIITQLKRVVKKGGVVVWIVADETINGSESGTSFRQALNFMEKGFNLHDTMIWEKPSFTDTGSLKTRYGNVFEYMFVFSKGTPKTFNPIKDRPNISVKRKIHGSVRQKDGSTKPVSTMGNIIPEYGQRFNVWKVNTAVSSKEHKGHPAQFPLQLVKDHIITWTNAEDVVMDIFMGSGTTGVACANLNRKFIGIEIEKKYFEMAKRRIETAERPLFNV